MSPGVGREACQVLESWSSLKDATLDWSDGRLVSSKDPNGGAWKMLPLRSGLPPICLSELVLSLVGGK